MYLNKVNCLGFQCISDLSYFETPNLNFEIPTLNIKKYYLILLINDILSQITRLLFNYKTVICIGVGLAIAVKFPLLKCLVVL